MKTIIEDSYVYFGKMTPAVMKRDMKIGESADFNNRYKSLWSNERIRISRYVSFKGTKEERLFIESYIRTKYAANRNLCHYGNDHFRARTINNLKGAENKFFQYVAEAFAVMETLKHKKFPYECHII